MRGILNLLCTRMRGDVSPEMASKIIQDHEGQQYPQEVGNGEVLEAIRQLKVGKNPRIDDTTAEVLQSGVVLKWMLFICNLAWEQGKRPKE